MLSSDEFYTIKCVLNYSAVKTDYNRYLGYEGDKPCIVYDDFKNIARYETSDEAIEAIKAVLQMTAPEEWSIHERINLMLIHNSNKYHVTQCKIEDDKLIELTDSNIAELNRHW